MKKPSYIMLAILVFAALLACNSGGGRGGGTDVDDEAGNCLRTITTGWAYACSAITKSCTTELWVRGGAAYVREVDITNGGTTVTLSVPADQDPLVFHGKVPCGVSVGYVIKWRGTDGTLCAGSHRVTYSTPTCSASGG